MLDIDNPTPNKLTFHNPTGFNGYLIGLDEYFAIYDLTP